MNDGAQRETAQAAEVSSSAYAYRLGIIGLFFFIFGFVTWLNGVLIPYLKIACELREEWKAYLVTFAFYISYTVMAAPSSWVLKKTGLLRGMQVGLFVMALGAFLFIPAALTREYAVFLGALFVIGTGLAILQTASNPYVTILGPQESAAKRISIMGICNKVAGALAPLALGAVILSNADELTRSLATMQPSAKALALDDLAARVVVPYSLMAGALALLAVLLRFAHLPEIEPDEPPTGERSAAKESLRQHPQLIFGVIALFFAVGAEVIAGDTIVNYGLSLGISLDEAKRFTSFTLTAMVVGYIAGIALIPKYLKQETALTAYSLVGIVCVLAATATTGFASVVCVALLGFANAILWPAIWPIAITGLGRLTGFGSSLLIMSIAGGALLPLVYGRLAMAWGNQAAYWLLVPCYLITAYYGIYGRRRRAL